MPTTRFVRHEVNSPFLDEFSFAIDETSPDFIVTSFCDWLSEYTAQGAKFADGQILEYGFSSLLCQVADRKLTLLAPDFQTMPIRWDASLAPVFAIIAFHKYIPESFGFAPNIPALQNTAIVGQRFSQLPMFAHRTVPSHENDSGWFFGSQSDEVDNNDPDQLQVMSLYQAVLSIPGVLRYLSLPTDCHVLFSGGWPVFLQDDRELLIPKGSYLDQLLRRDEA